MITLINPLPSATDILAQSVSPYFLPLHFLSGDRQLPPQALEGTLRHADERPVQLLLVITLRRGDARDNRLGSHRGDRDADRLGGVEGHVPVFVIVHVDVDLAGDGCGRGRDGDLVDGSESTVPVKSRGRTFPAGNASGVVSVLP